MAIDTAAKRASCISFCTFTTPWYVPAGGIDDSGQRAAVVFFYGGLGAAGESGGRGGLRFDRRRRFIAAWLGGGRNDYSNS